MEVQTDALARLVALLGDDVCFVPCEWGTKKPVVTYVERPFEGTKTPAYRALFDGEPRNIAVYLGKASGGLCAIDFDADEDLAAFLAANPKLARTTRSCGSRGGMVWIRVAPRDTEVRGPKSEVRSEDQRGLRSAATSNGWTVRSTMCFGACAAGGCAGISLLTTGASGWGHRRQRRS